KREKRGNSAYYSVADPAVFELCEIVCGNIERALDEELRAFGG
ncbi:MAG: transcriptional regulator, partial [Deltaproteobacteria bacterium]|nr:transcriptional regulator [Deltaproteobacteria bacterium]